MRTPKKFYEDNKTKILVTGVALLGAAITIHTAKRVGREAAQEFVLSGKIVINVDNERLATIVGPNRAS